LRLTAARALSIVPRESTGCATLRDSPRRAGRTSHLAGAVRPQRPPPLADVRVIDPEQVFGQVRLVHR